MNVGRCIQHTVHAVVQPNITVHNARICLQILPSDAAFADGNSDTVKTRPLTPVDRTCVTIGDICCEVIDRLT